MKFLLIVSSLLISTSFAQQTDLAEDALARRLVKTSTIQDRKISVKGINNHKRMAISSVAGSTSKELNRLLKTKDLYEGERSIYIRMHEKGLSKRNLGVRSLVTPFGENDLVIELLVDSRTEMDRSVLRQGIVEILLYRLGLEGEQILDEGQSARVPLWLSTGLIGAMEWKNEGGERGVYEHLLERPDVYTLQKAFEATAFSSKGFDAAERSFFKACSTSIVLALLRQENGEEAMLDFISEVVLYEGEIEELVRKYFPTTGVGANALQKTWSLQLAEMAAPKLIETFSMQETDAKLARLLFFTLADESGKSELIPLGEYAQLEDMEPSERVAVTENIRHGVVQLSNRCHPVYRPLLLEYAKLTSTIVAGKFAKVKSDLSELAQIRQNIVEQDIRCRDYLDWYQISEAREVTGDFSGYMNLKEKIHMEREQRKDDVIDPYLDRIQDLMSQ